MFSTKLAFPELHSAFLENQLEGAADMLSGRSTPEVSQDDPVPD